MPAITNLPCEVIASILRGLDQISSLVSSLLTCRHFYTSFKENPSIGYEILRRQVNPALIPCCATIIEASRLPYPRTLSSIRELLHTLYDKPDQLVAQVQPMPLSMALRIARTHGIIETFVADFAKDAWAVLSTYTGDAGLPDNFTLSPEEHFRFCRAFYRVEIFLILFRGQLGTFRSPFNSRESQYFFAKHSPWENEQLACIHDFLEKRLTEASRDVVAHDVDFGELSVDYLSLGGDNSRKQLWMSFGVCFLDRLKNENSYEGKKALLDSVVSAGSANLYDGLMASPGEDSTGDALLEEYTEEDIKDLVRHSDLLDTDNGPYSAWFSAHRDVPRSSWVMFDNNAGLRECAYVLWDIDRIERYNLLKLFENVPVDPSHLYTDSEFEEMQESFEERSKIWQKGGSGYWSKGDTSRIMWQIKST